MRGRANLIPRLDESGDRSLPSSRVVGAFVFPEFWNNPERAKSDIAGLRESGVTAIMTESDSYEHFVVDLTHQAGLRLLTTEIRYQSRGPTAIIGPVGRSKDGRKMMKDGSAFRDL